MLRTVCAQVSMVYSIKEMLVFLHPRKTKLCCLSTSRHFFSHLHTSFGFKIIVIQSPSWVWLFVNPWTAARQASLSFTISQLKLMSIELVMPSNHLILVTPFSSCPKSFPVSESFPVSQLFKSGGQSIEASASVLPMNIQGRFPLRLTGLVSLLSKELSRVFSNTTVWKHQFFSTQSSLRSNSWNSNCWHMTGLTLLLTTCSRCPQGQCRCSLTQLLFTQPVMSSSFQPPGLQHARPPCPSPSPGVCPSSHSLLQWGRSAISSSDILFSFCPLSFPASGTFPMSPLFSSGDQNTGASASVLPVNIQGWSPLRLTGLISLLSKSLSGLLSSTTVRRHQFFGVLHSYSLALTAICDHWEESP